MADGKKYTPDMNGDNVILNPRNEKERLWNRARELGITAITSEGGGASRSLIRSQWQNISKPDLIRVIESRGVSVEEERAVETVKGRKAPEMNRNSVILNPKTSKEMLWNRAKEMKIKIGGISLVQSQWTNVTKEQLKRAIESAGTEPPPVAEEKLEAKETPQEKPITPTQAPQNKIFNPATGKWVNRDGAVGKRLVAIEQRRAEAQYSLARKGRRAREEVERQSMAMEDKPEARVRGEAKEMTFKEPEPIYRIPVQFHPKLKSYYQAINPEQIPSDFVREQIKEQTLFKMGLRHFDPELMEIYKKHDYGDLIEVSKEMFERVQQREADAQEESRLLNEQMEAKIRAAREKRKAENTAKPSKVITAEEEERNRKKQEAMLAKRRKAIEEAEAEERERQSMAKEDKPNDTGGEAEEKKGTGTRRRRVALKNKKSKKK